MSRDLHVLLLDTMQFQAVQGSGNHALLERILEDCRTRIDAHDRYFRDDMKLIPYMPLADALRQIVNGEIDPNFHPRFQFEHAASLLADALGEELDSDLLMESRPALWNEADFVLRSRSRQAAVPNGSWPPFCALLERGPLLNVPLDEPKMRLGSGYLTAVEAERALEAAERVELETESGFEDLRWPGLALEIVRTYRQWLKQASASGEGLFFHV
jgi:hypothetical protein